MGGQDDRGVSGRYYPGKRASKSDLGLGLGVEPSKVFRLRASMAM